MILGFDEINSLSAIERTVENRAESDGLTESKTEKSKNRSIPYKKYFGIMNLTEKQKKDREKFAEQLEDDLIMIMSLYDLTREYNITDDSFIVQELKDAYLKATASFGVPSDEYITEVALAFAVNFIKATKEHKNDAWYTSKDRAKYNAENEANTVLNYKDYSEAKKRGFTKKRWWTENDSRVRMTHIPLEGEVIPIDDLFVVGEALMRFPHDYEYAAEYPEELVNCRCSITYSN